MSRFKIGNMTLRERPDGGGLQVLRENGLWYDLGETGVARNQGETESALAAFFFVVECADGSHCHHLGSPGSDWEDYVGPYFRDEDDAGRAVADLDDPTTWKEWPIADRTVEQCGAGPDHACLAQGRAAGGPGDREWPRCCS